MKGKEEKKTENKDSLLQGIRKACVCVHLCVCVVLYN